MLCLVLKKITDVDIRRGTEAGKGCGTHTVLVAETAGFTMSGISIDNSSNYAILGYELVRPRTNLRRKLLTFENAKSEADQLHGKT